jgi:hypothetical protein
VAKGWKKMNILARGKHLKFFITSTQGKKIKFNIKNLFKIAQPDLFRKVPHKSQKALRKRV